MKEIKLNDELEEMIFLGIDIGTEMCKAVLMRIDIQGEDNFKYEILEADSTSIRGATERSRILNSEKTIEVLGPLIDNIIQGYSGSVYTSYTIHDQSLRSKYNRARNPFSKHDRIISQNDIELALHMAGNAQIENDREYLHLLPRMYYVNGSPTKEYPVGLKGASIDAEVLLVSVLKDTIKQIVFCSNEIGFPCNYICATPLATGECVLTSREKNEGALVIDMGAGITSATVFENNMPKAVSIIPLGGDDISRDISTVLNVPLNTAQNIKHRFGIVDSEYLSMFEPILRLEINNKITDVMLQDIYQIVLARTAEILGLIKQRLQTSVEAFPYPVVLTGGSARILGLKKLSERAFNSEARIAQPWNWGGPSEKYIDPSYSSVIGVCLAGFQHYLANGWTDMDDKSNQFLHTSNSTRGHSLKKVYSSLSEKFRKLLSLDDVE